MARFTMMRKLGRDQEVDREELREVIDDPDASFADVLACAIEMAPPEQQSEVMEAMREISEDRRGAHAWAKDRREMYRHNRARDAGPQDPPALGGGDRHKLAGDTALRRRADARAEFAEWFPAAARIERG